MAYGKDPLYGAVYGVVCGAVCSSQFPGPGPLYSMVGGAVYGAACGLFLGPDLLYVAVYESIRAQRATAVSVADSATTRTFQK